MSRTLACVVLLAVRLARAADDLPDRKHARPAPHSAPPASRPAPTPPAAPTPPPVVTVIVPPVVTNCWVDAHLFRSLTAGTVDYCRGHLDYAPGALDCYAYTDQVCSLYSPTSGWDEARRPMAPSVFPCPDDVEPPVCPRLRWP